MGRKDEKLGEGHHGHATSVDNAVGAELKHSTAAVTMMPGKGRHIDLLEEIVKELGKLNNGIARLSRTVELADSTAAHFHRKRIEIAINEMFDFIRTEMMSAVFVGGDRMQIKRLALESVTIEGAHLEMGVFKGDSLNYFADLKKQQLFHGFDSFEGLPEAWSSGHTGTADSTYFDAGFFSTDMPKTRENVRLHKGWFKQTVPAWKEESSEKVAFLHIDCDIYSSTAYVLEALTDRIVPGTIIVFDELLGYYEWRNGEYKAFMEFVVKHEVKYEYLFYRYDCVVVRVTKVGII